MILKAALFVAMVMVVTAAPKDDLGEDIEFDRQQLQTADTNQGITKPAIHRLVRRSGLSHFFQIYGSGMNFMEFLLHVIHLATKFAMNEGRFRVTYVDMARALEEKGSPKPRF
ncbi:histone H4-like [Branchiostoma floridae]|nr:histone H4-like [Branchiostoma floridae]XP_035683572.1 histone H4-like [Branchiostoma floridae]